MTNSIRIPDVDHVPKPSFSSHKYIGCFAGELHRHQKKHQLVYAEDGVLHLRTGESQFLLPAHHAAWIPADCWHQQRSDSPHLYWRSLYFTPQPDEPAILKQIHIFPVSTLAREMIIYSERWRPTDPADALEQQFLQTIYALVPQWCDNLLPLKLPVSDHPQVATITAYLRDNLHETTAQETLAGRFGISGRTLLRLFKRELGMTVQTYIRVARVIWALELLTEPDTAVTEVCYEVGYRSLSSFSQTFQQLVGVTPSEYQQQAYG